MTVTTRKTLASGLCLAAAAGAAYAMADPNLFLAALMIFAALKVAQVIVNLLHEGDLSNRLARN